IQAGDVITAVNGAAIKDAKDLARHIASMAPGSTVKLTVWRKGEEKSFSVPLGELPAQREAKAAPDSSGPHTTDVPRLGRPAAPAQQGQTEWGAPPASVAPAGGSNQGDGLTARPHPL